MRDPYFSQHDANAVGKLRNEIRPFVAEDPMTTTASIRRRGRGLHPRRDPVQQFRSERSQPAGAFGSRPSERRPRRRAQPTCEVVDTAAMACRPADVRVVGPGTGRLVSGRRPADPAGSLRKGWQSPRGSRPPRIASGAYRGPQICRRGTRQDRQRQPFDGMVMGAIGGFSGGSVRRTTD